MSIEAVKAFQGKAYRGVMLVTEITYSRRSIKISLISALGYINGVREVWHFIIPYTLVDKIITAINNIEIGDTNKYEINKLFYFERFTTKRGCYFEFMRDHKIGQTAGEDDIDFSNNETEEGFSIVKEDLIVMRNLLKEFI